MKIIFYIALFTANIFAYNITVSITPQKYFVEQIAKDKANINVMVKPGFSPATYSPKTSQMLKLANSSLYFTIDVPFEDAWLEKFKASNSKMIIIDTAKHIKKLKMEKHEHHEKDEEEVHNGTDDSHHHEKGLDPHIWLDPKLVKIQAKTILEALINIDYKNKDFYTKNYHIFINKLNKLDNTIQGILKDIPNKTFMVFHPSWQYFAKAYGLEQIAVEKEGKEPKVKELIELVKEAKEHNIKVLFVAPQFSQNSAKKIAHSINGKVISIDHLAYDWEENLIKIAKTFQQLNK